MKEKLMALIKCKECSEKISKKASTCPKCGAPQKRKTLGCGAFIIILIILGAIGSIVSNFNSSDNNSTKIQNTSHKPSVAKQQPPAELPANIFSASSRPGHSRSQIRALALPGVYTKNQFMQMARDLAGNYKSQAAGSFLVQFFSDSSTFDGWDGTGLLQDSDWPHWLCRITIDTDKNGQLYARTFELAVDENTGEKRTDVLK
jgi:hypothetical protein